MSGQKIINGLREAAADAHGIPADAMFAAGDVIADIELGGGDPQVTIARAIMAERERCALIADTAASPVHPLSAEIPQRIAAAIRKGEA